MEAKQCPAAIDPEHTDNEAASKRHEFQGIKANSKQKQDSGLKQDSDSRESKESPLSRSTISSLAKDRQNFSIVVTQPQETHTLG